MNSLRLTKDLIAALEDAGADPTRVDDNVVVAAYLDLLAKEYGLTESLALDTDPIARAQQLGPLMDVVGHYLPGDGAGLDADTVRARLYEVVVALAADPSMRKTLNQNNPLTEDEFLYVAQIYWNLEANEARPKLPIKPTGDRDIPVPGSSRDFATMHWTARTNEKGTYKSSGQGFRKQGARLVVLTAQKLMENTSPMPNTSSALTVTTTSDPEAPLEVVLKDLVKRAQDEGQHDVAVQTATSYLNIIKQRAEANPFATEADLADAYMLRGFAQVHRYTDLMSSRWVGADSDGQDDLDAAIQSLTTLADIEPDNLEHRVNLIQALALKWAAQVNTGDETGAKATTRRAFTVLTEMPADHPKTLFSEFFLYFAFRVERFGVDEALNKAEAALTRLDALDLTGIADITRDEIESLPKVIEQMHFYLESARLLAGDDEAALQLLRDAVAEAEHLVESGEDPQRVLLDPLAKLARALAVADRLSEGVPVSERLLSLATPDYVREHPEFDPAFYFYQVSAGRGDEMRITEAHLALLEAYSDSASTNMARIITLLIAYCNLTRARLVRTSVDEGEGVA